MEPRLNRFELRLEAFGRAMRRLEQGIALVRSRADDEELTMEEEGLIQRFEYSFELGWKLLQDVEKDLNGQGLGGPRAAIRWATAEGWVDDGEVWMSMPQSRNVTTHVYDRAMIQPVLQKIRGTYFRALHGLEEAARNHCTGGSD